MARGDNFKNGNVDRSTKPILKNGSPVCECASCGYFFSGPSVFDKHLMERGTANPACRTEQEMFAAGMVRNEHGVWLKGGPAEKDEEDAA